jgi:hypothetical protein
MFDDLPHRQFVSVDDWGDWVHWDVNDFLLRMRQCAPQRRWMTVNTNFFGPDFSLSALIDVPLDVLRRTLKQHDWLRTMTQKNEYRWIHRPKKTEHLKIRALLDSTEGGHVVWFWMDLYGAPPMVTPGDMIDPSNPLRRGWDQLSEDERRASREAVAADDRYGELAPPGGWPSREEIGKQLRARVRMTRRSGSSAGASVTGTTRTTRSTRAQKRGAESAPPKTPPKEKRATAEDAAADDSSH